MRILVRWLSRWPLWFLHALGGGMGWLVYWLSPAYRRRLLDNARIAGLSGDDRRAAVAEAGRMVMELPRVWLRPPSLPIPDPVHWNDLEVLDGLMVRGRGLVLLTPHLGSFEVAAQAYTERFGAERPMTVLFRPARQAWLRALEADARSRPAMAAAPATLAGVRQLLRALQRGEAVGMLPDQVPPEGQGVWAPFFGRPAYTMTLASRLAQQTGAAIGLLWTTRLPRGGGYAVHARRLSEPLPEDDAVAAASAINRAMESVIRSNPRQYLWGYHRYKAPRRVEAA
jgi:Kdo2-lipid IVA lauroyltransferase/acyltransferase